MKKTRMEKGITLVALVITVVVLLILAGVAISTINETGIIAKSNNAAHNFNAKQNEENGILAGYEDIIGKYDGSGNTGAVTILAGTYNVDTSIYMPDTSISQNIVFSWQSNQYTKMTAGTREDGVDLVGFDNEYVYIYDHRDGYNLNNIASNPIQITEDQEVSAEFATWFNAIFTKRS